MIAQPCNECFLINKFDIPSHNIMINLNTVKLETKNSKYEVDQKKSGVELSEQ